MENLAINDRDTMMRLEEALRACLSAAGKPPVAGHQCDAHFWNELGLDSLDAQDFFVRVSEDFGITIPEQLYFELSSLTRVAAFLESRW